MERKVLVVNYSGHDLTPATQYGKLTFLTEGSVNIFSTDRLIFTLRQKLKDAASEDFLLLTGSPIINALASMILLQKFGVVNYLVFNSKTRAYVPRTITEIQIQGVE